MKKICCALWALLLAMTGALAELPESTTTDFFLFPPETAHEMKILWQGESKEPEVVLLNIPEKHRDYARAAMEASSAWRTDLEPFAVEDAKIILEGMGCSELPEMPEDMVFEGMCFWMELVDFAAMDEDQAAFLMAMAMVSVGLRGETAIDISLRIGFYDVDTGTLLMAAWLVE